MRTAFAWLLVGFVMVGLAGSAAAEHKITSKKGGVSAVFPEKPTQKDMKDGEQWLLESADKKGAYLLQYNKFENEIDTDDAAIVKKVMDGGLDALLKGFKGSKLVSSKDSVEDDYPVRDFEVDMGNGGFYVGRLVLEDDRLLHGAVAGVKEFVKGKEAVAFLKSLEVEDE